MSKAKEPKIAAAKACATTRSQPDEAKRYRPSEECWALIRGNRVPADLRPRPPEPFSEPKPEPTKL